MLFYNLTVLPRSVKQETGGMARDCFLHAQERPRYPECLGFVRFHNLASSGGYYLGIALEIPTCFKKR